MYTLVRTWLASGACTLVVFLGHARPGLLINVSARALEEFLECADVLPQWRLAYILQPVRLLVNDRKFPVGNSIFFSHQTSQQ